uniref:Metallophosphoesterase n=1 Tax=Caenorhabditis tropicalis TaxID=1561998 RepID=A0A1I7T8G2_9PELO
MSSNLIRFVGNHDVASEGKFLFEILSQLRNFGVGRLVTKNEWARKWPDSPSFVKILRAEPEMDRWLFEGKVYAEWVFRGKNLGIYEFSKDLNRSDWQLVHKHQEKSYTACSTPMQPLVFPDSFPLPPLQVHLSQKSARKSGLDEKTIQRRAPLVLSIDPEFEHLKPFIKQETPNSKSSSIYEEVDRNALLDLYGNELPVKVEAWNAGPAAFQPRFNATKVRIEEQRVK